MDDDGTHERHRRNFAELAADERQVRSRHSEARHHRVSPQYSYQMKLGRVTIELDTIEFRILRFLASQPYRAFTRRRIAAAISTQRHPVAPEALDCHIARLRDALGFFRDYIQTVPYIGYRFRA